MTTDSWLPRREVRIRYFYSISRKWSASWFRFLTIAAYMNARGYIQKFYLLPTCYRNSSVILEVS